MSGTELWAAGGLDFSLWLSVRLFGRILSSFAYNLRCRNRNSCNSTPVDDVDAFLGLAAIRAEQSWAEQRRHGRSCSTARSGIKNPTVVFWGRAARVKQLSFVATRYYPTAAVPFSWPLYLRLQIVCPPSKIRTAFHMLNLCKANTFV